MNTSRTGGSGYRYYKFIAAKLNELRKYSDGIALPVDRLKKCCYLTRSSIRNGIGVVRK